MIINVLMKFEKWDQMMTMKNEWFVFQEINVDEYTRNDMKFREFILLRINWTNRLTKRETKMLSLLFKNKMTTGRNLVMKNEQFMIVTEYHKSQAIMNDVKSIARFLSWDLTKLLVTYLSIVIPFHEYMCPNYRIPPK